MWPYVSGSLAIVSAHVSEQHQIFVQTKCVEITNVELFSVKLSRGIICLEPSYGVCPELRVNDGRRNAENIILLAKSNNC